jgi:hypothetical protein
MKTMILCGPVLSILLCLTGCGATVASDGSEDVIRVTGITEVLRAGTPAETVIITDDATGEVFALVGDMALDIIPVYGQQTSVIGRITEDGCSVREDLRKLNVNDFSITGGEETPNY